MVNRKKAALSLALMAAVALTGSLSVYASEANAQGNTPVVTAVAQIPEASPSLHVDNTKWNYDETNDIYYQIGLVYCAKPQATEYESLAVYVPGAYMQGVKNPDGTYTCQINPKAKVGNYTAVTAPVVMPVNTGGYAAQKAPSSYDVPAFLRICSRALSTYMQDAVAEVMARIQMGQPMTAELPGA